MSPFLQKSLFILGLASLGAALSAQAASNEIISNAFRIGYLNERTGEYFSTTANSSAFLVGPMSRTICLNEFVQSAKNAQSAISQSYDELLNRADQEYQSKVNAFTQSNAIEHVARMEFELTYAVTGDPDYRYQLKISFFNREGDRIGSNTISLSSAMNNKPFKQKDGSKIICPAVDAETLRQVAANNVNDVADRAAQSYKADLSLQSERDEFEKQIKMSWSADRDVRQAQLAVVDRRPAIVENVLRTRVTSHAKVGR